MKIERFQEKHIEDAAILFQKNYFELKEQFPFLPNKFEKNEIICTKLKEIILNNPSYIAIDSNKIIGYITGFSNIKELKGSLTGSYTPEWGHSSIYDDKEKIYNQMYSTISKELVANKNFTQIISFLSNTDLVNTFLMLGFGMQVIDAVKDLEITPMNISSEYKIRKATRSDIEELRKIEKLMNIHLESAPIFLKRNKEKMDDKKIIKNFISDKNITLIAAIDDEIISCIRGEKDSGNIPIIDCKGTLGINFGYTKSKQRKTGIASVLLNEILKIVKEEGYNFCSVDFESQNIEGRAFWLKYFKPIVFSMMRKIDDRIN